jgi:tRNA threonylcarbamoyladenosine biosynthesis protein TsaB
MGAYLALETSTPLGSVAVGEEGRPLAEAMVGVATRHSEALLPAVDFVLARAGLAPGQLAGLVVGGGPGSFTGVRIAAATAKGMARALELPLFAYSGLAAVAAGVAALDRPVCALFDARRGEVYAACYVFGAWDRFDVLLEPVAAPLEVVLQRAAAVAGGSGGGGRLLYAGEGALRHQARIEAAGGVVAPPHLAAPRAATLLWLAARWPERGRIEAAAAWEPNYLRSAGAERGVHGD